MVKNGNAYSGCLLTAFEDEIPTKKRFGKTHGNHGHRTDGWQWGLIDALEAEQQKRSQQTNDHVQHQKSYFRLRTHVTTNKLWKRAAAYFYNRVQKRLFGDTLSSLALDYNESMTVGHQGLSALQMVWPTHGTRVDLRWSSRCKLNDDCSAQNTWGGGTRCWPMLGGAQKAEIIWYIKRGE